MDSAVQEIPPESKDSVTIILPEIKRSSSIIITKSTPSQSKELDKKIVKISSSIEIIQKNIDKDKTLETAEEVKNKEETKNWCPCPVGFRNYIQKLWFKMRGSETSEDEEGGKYDFYDYNIVKLLHGTRG